MNEAYLCLGGNLGDCFVNLNKACLLIANRAGKVLQQSSVYGSAAWGMENAPDFLNQAIKIETELPAQELIKVLSEIEKTLGRERKDHTGYQNRIMDIDILFFNQEIIKGEGLEIPHPRLHLRNFVLIPLMEIAPGFIHSLFNKTITALAEACPDKGEIKKVTHAL